MKPLCRGYSRIISIAGIPSDVIIIIIIISFISYIQQDLVSKKPHQKYKTWCGQQFNYLHGRQIQDYVFSITLVYSMTGHSVATYHNTISNNASIDVIIHFLLLLYHLVMSLLIATYVPRHIFGGMSYFHII